MEYVLHQLILMSLIRREIILCNLQLPAWDWRNSELFMRAVVIKVCFSALPWFCFYPGTCNVSAFWCHRCHLLFPMHPFSARVNKQTYNGSVRIHCSMKGCIELHKTSHPARKEILLFLPSHIWISLRPFLTNTLFPDYLTSKVDKMHLGLWSFAC